MSLNISANDSRSFPCPACKEVINTSITHCTYCGAPIDASLAQQAADWQDRLNQAFNDGNFARNVAQVTGVFYFISFVPVIGNFGGLGFLIGMIATPIMVARWFYKYHFSIPAARRPHPELQQARRRALIATGIWIALLVVWFILGVIFVLLRAVSSQT
jgi:hypothetical protein